MTKALLTSAVAALLASLPLLPHHAAVAGTDLPCGESDAVEIANAISIKQIVGLIREDGTPQLTLHFDVPMTLEGAPLQDVFLSILGPDEAMDFTTPLKTWTADDGLEGMLIATVPRIRDYSIWATYTPIERDACGFVTRLKLAGNAVVDDRLACLRNSTPIECNHPELPISTPDRE